MRRTDVTKEVFRLANYFAKNFSNYSFNGFASPADEPVLALAMAVCNCKPLDLYELCFAPKRKQIKLDITIPKAHYIRNKNSEYDVNLIHWSNYRTKQSLYKFEVEKLMYIKDKRNINSLYYHIFYQYKLKYYLLRIMDIIPFIQRVKKKIYR